MISIRHAGQFVIFVASMSLVRCSMYCTEFETPFPVSGYCSVVPKIADALVLNALGPSIHVRQKGGVGVPSAYVEPVKRDEAADESKSTQHNTAQQERP